MIYIILIIIQLSYFVLITTLIIGFNKISKTKQVDKTYNRKFTIIIPFRNEADSIPSLVGSLLKITYPKTHFEILFVNDASTDNSVPLLTEFIIKNSNWKILDNVRKSNSPKKDAIDTAIQHANYDWIITTDADCEVPKKWLQSFATYINYCLRESNTNKNIMIAAPVAYKATTTFLHQFQRMDFLSLIGATIGGFGIHKPFMCNGANLCYNKDAFFNVNGFEGNNNIASGDDIFLMEKFSKHYPNQVYYLKSKDALVITKPENSLKDLINQRVRWASKTSATKNNFSKIVGILVFLENLLICGLWSMLLFSNNTKFLIALLILKFSIDFVLIKKTSVFFNEKQNLSFYSFSAIFYPFFVVFIVFRSFFSRYEWKSRNFKK